MYSRGRPASAPVYVQRGPPLRSRWAEEDYEYDRPRYAPPPRQGYFYDEEETNISTTDGGSTDVATDLSAQVPARPLSRSATFHSNPIREERTYQVDAPPIHTSYGDTRPLAAPSKPRSASAMRGSYEDDGGYRALAAPVARAPARWDDDEDLYQAPPRPRGQQQYANGAGAAHNTPARQPYDYDDESVDDDDDDTFTAVTSDLSFEGYEEPPPRRHAPPPQPQRGMRELRDPYADFDRPPSRGMSRGPPPRQPLYQDLRAPAGCRQSFSYNDAPPPALCGRAAPSYEDRPSYAPPPRADYAERPAPTRRRSFLVDDMQHLSLSQPAPAPVRVNSRAGYRAPPPEPESIVSEETASDQTGSDSTAQPPPSRKQVNSTGDTVDSPEEEALLRLLQALKFSTALRDFHKMHRVGVRKTLVCADGRGHAYVKVHCTRLPKHEVLEQTPWLKKYWYPLVGPRWEFRTETHKVTVVWQTVRL